MWLQRVLRVVDPAKKTLHDIISLLQLDLYSNLNTFMFCICIYIYVYICMSIYIYFYLHTFIGTNIDITEIPC